MTTTTVRPNPSRRRRLVSSGPVLLLGPAVAAILLSGAPAAVAMFSSASQSPVSVSGDQIELVKSSRELAAREPRDHRGDGPTPAPVPGGPGPVSKPKFDHAGYSRCLDNGGALLDCCLFYDGKWIPPGPNDATGHCEKGRTVGESMPGRPGLPTEAVDTGSPQQGSPPLPPVAVDPGSPQSPPVTTPPPVVRDHRTP
jgi:hypothetical protein